MYHKCPTLRGLLFFENSGSPTRIFYSLEVKKQSENDSTKGAHAIFEPGTFKSLRKSSPSRSYARPLDSHLECDENKKTKKQFAIPPMPRLNPPAVIFRVQVPQSGLLKLASVHHFLGCPCSHQQACVPALRWSTK